MNPIEFVRLSVSQIFTSPREGGERSRAEGPRERGRRCDLEANTGESERTPLPNPLPALGGGGQTVAVTRAPRSIRQCCYVIDLVRLLVGIRPGSSGARGI